MYLIKHAQQARSKQFQVGQVRKWAWYLLPIRKWAWQSALTTDHVFEVVFEPRFRALGLNIHSNLYIAAVRSAAGPDSHAASVCNGARAAPAPRANRISLLPACRLRLRVAPGCMRTSTTYEVGRQLLPHPTKLRRLVRTNRTASYGLAQ